MFHLPEDAKPHWQTFGGERNQMSVFDTNRMVESCSYLITEDSRSSIDRGLQILIWNIS